MLLGRTKVTMQYPEQKWDSSLPDHYRGAPALVRDEDGRVRCVACQLCEFICPPRAIKIVAGEIPSTDRFAKVEKYPEEFDIDMVRCIFWHVRGSLSRAGNFSAQRLRHHRFHARRDGASQREAARDRGRHARGRPKMEREKMKPDFRFFSLRALPFQSPIYNLQSPIL